MREIGVDQVFAAAAKALAEAASDQPQVHA
jgi:hypothetical protein